MALAYHAFQAERNELGRGPMNEELQRRNAYGNSFLASLIGDCTSMSRLLAGEAELGENLSTKRPMLRLFSFALCLALLAPACSTLNSSSSSPEKNDDSDSQEMAADDFEIQPLEHYEISDPSQRFTAKIEAVEPPRLTSEEGYFRVIVPVGAPEPINCFVYEGAIAAGHAVTKLLRAVSVGIDFTHVESVAVREIGGAPVVFLQGDYRETDRGHTDAEGKPKRGELKLAISPRMTFPVVCTLEARGLEQSFKRIVSGLLSSFETTEEPQRPDSMKELVLSEVWRLSKGGHPVGFSRFQMFRSGNNVTTSLQVSATFNSYRSTLRTTDSVVVESEDESGVLTGKWLDTVDTRTVLRLMMERRKGQPGSYRYAGSLDSRPVQGEFKTESPLRSAAAGTEIFTRARDAGLPPKDASYDQFLPLQTLLQASQVSYHWGGASPARKISVTKGELALSVQLGKDGFPKRIRAKGTDREAILLRRIRHEFPARAPSSLSR